MPDKKFYLQRYLRDATGAYKEDGAQRSLEDDFGYIRYKSMTGINSIGKQKGVYSESYPESDAVRVWVNENPSMEQIEHTLTVYSFGSAPSSPSSDDIPSLVKAMEDSIHTLYVFLCGALILWGDEYRQRKALLYVSDAISPTTDNIKDIPYLQCDIKFKNVFGRTFPLDDTTIEEWLGNDSKKSVI